LALHILCFYKRKKKYEKKEDIDIYHTTHHPHEEGEEKEEDKHATTNTQHIHIHYAIHHASPQNERPITPTEGASPPLQSEASVRVWHDEVLQRSRGV
jgi:hypothetical protein